MPIYRFVPALICCCAISASAAGGAEIAVLTPETWQAYVPIGKEVDAIYGDVVLRNDRLVAVIAQPLATRNANMTVKNVGGCLIDFTTREQQNDQLGAFYPLGKTVDWRTLRTEPAMKPAAEKVEAATVSVVVSAVLKETGLTAETTYTLADGAEHVLVETKLTNTSAKPLITAAKDETRTDGTVFIKGTTGRLNWAYDRWWNAAYGIVDAAPRAEQVTVAAQGNVMFSRRLHVARDLRTLLDSTGVVSQSTSLRTLSVAERGVGPAGREPGIPNVYVELSREGKTLTAGYTDVAGEFPVRLAGDAEITVSSAAHQPTKIRLDSRPQQVIYVDRPGTLSAVITNEQGGPSPCKVQFRGVGDTKDPNFFDKSGEHAVGNLYYSHDGKFTLPIPVGKYACTISYGTEHDVVERELEIASGKETPLAAKLIRTVQTPGFISADFHSHSSPSGDNVSSQFGRVLNLLCEHIEYAPCTEHNRLSTYTPHLKRLGVEHLMGTCVGIELTSSPLPTSHFNAFPLKLQMHTQDGGGPTSDADPSVEVSRLAMWDDRSEKLIQQNHPDIGWVFYDKNGDGKPDGGFFPRPLPHLDVIEVHPPQDIFKPAILKTNSGDTRNNRIVNWLQLLNQGYRLGGVVNTDAHYNLHGSGWLRIYVESPTDDPAKVTTDDIVHAAEHGHIVMTNGPYLEVSVRASQDDKRSLGGPGDDIVAVGGKVFLHVRVQCPNWFDVDRVQLFINGRPNEKLNFTRKNTPAVFHGGALKFEQTWEVELKEDAHLIVATIGEDSGLGYVMGSEHKDDRPTAVSNPIFIDVDGRGFKPNQDTLGAPLPVKGSTSK
jgi:hypothetical protein